jgi:mannitol-specific phosphotransferase system IIBC component
MFFGSFIFPVLIGFIVLKNSDRLYTPEFQQKFGTLVENISLKEGWRVLWNIVGILRIMVTVTLLILLRDYAALQTLTLIMVSYII